MSIQLRIYYGDGRAVRNLTAEGEISIEDAVWWFVESFSPIMIDTQFVGEVVMAIRDRVIIHNRRVRDLTLRRLCRLGGRVTAERIDEETAGHFESYIFEPSPSSQSAFDDFVSLIKTYAKAWQDEHPEVFGRIKDEFFATYRV